MSYGLNAQITGDAEASRKEAAEGGNGTFPPLPKGKYQAVIVPLKPNSNIPLEVGKWGGSGDNSEKPVVRLAFKIVDESPTGKGRIIHDRVPLFNRWAPTQKNPQGATARAFWDFWEKALGVPYEQIAAGQLPGAEAIIGKRVTITLTAPIEPRNEKDLEHNPLGTNEVDFYDAPAFAANGLPDTTATPLRTPGVSVATWLDDKDNVIPGYVFGFQKAAQAQAQGGAAGYGAAPAGGYGAPAQGAAPATQAWAQPAAPAAGAAGAWGGQPAAGGQVTQGPWGQPGGQPAQPSEGLQQAAVAGASY